MSVVYIMEQGACICKRGERILVEKEGKEIKEIEVFKIRSILIFGYVQITTQAMRLLLYKQVDTAFLTMDGHFLGKLTPGFSKNIFLRIGQVHCADDDDFSLQVSRKIVEAKVGNSVVLLREFERNHPDLQVKNAVTALLGFIPSILAAGTIESLLGLEGNAASAYWTAFGRMCLGDVTFSQRVKRPATDPVNSLLNLGYSVTLTRIHSCMDAVGLDPYIGFFHQAHYGRPSLAADILEEFRSPLVDRFTLSLINKKMIKAADFELHEESGGIRMTREAAKRYFVKFEEFMNRRLAGFDEPEATFSSLLKRQVRRIAKSIEYRDHYEPFRMKSD